MSTPSGPRSIESLVPGDELFVADPVTGAIATRRVAALTRHVMRETFVLDAGSIHLRVTAEHPIWDPTRRKWNDAGELRAGDTIMVLANGSLGQRRVENVRRDRACVTVYDLSVEGPEHTFFADGVLVHNKSVICEPYPRCESRVDAASDAGDASLDGPGDATNAGDAGMDAALDGSQPADAAADARSD